MTAQLAPPALRTLIVGLGHAGRDLHLTAVRRLGLATNICAVERDSLQGAHCAAFADLSAAAAAFRPAETVVHICTPPAGHAGVLAEAADLGYRRFVVEKPLAPSAAEAERMAGLRDAYDLAVVVVANWLFSRLTERLRAVLAEGRARLAAVRMRQHKPRIGRSLTDPGHRTALEVEMPHLVALAVGLFGTDLRVTRAVLRDLCVDGQRLPGLGGAEADLVTSGGVPVVLSSDLTSPSISRSVRLRWADGTEAEGHYPADSRELGSQLFTYDSSGRQTGRMYLADDTMAACLTDAYAWFAGLAPQPSSGVDLHVHVCRLLEDIGRAAGLAATNSRTDLRS